MLVKWYANKAKQFSGESGCTLSASYFFVAGTSHFYSIAIFFLKLFYYQAFHSFSQRPKYSIAHRGQPDYVMHFGHMLISRTMNCRSCYWFFFIHIMWPTLNRTLLASATVDGIIAPTREQCEKYSSWLHIYGKERAKITHRMANLLDIYEVHNSSLEHKLPIESLL